MMRGTRWPLVLALGLACGGEPAESAPEAEPPPGPAMDRGRPGPAPATEVAHARAVVEALAREDWEGYTNLLATRADMIGLFADEERDTRRKRRDRRRLVWRRINKLRGEGAERGWKSVIHEGRMRSLSWSEATVVNVWRGEPKDRRLPPDAIAGRLVAELEHDGTTHWLRLGTCAKAERGWVALYPLALLDRPPKNKGEGLLRAEPPSDSRGSEPRGPRGSPVQ